MKNAADFDGERTLIAETLSDADKIDRPEPPAAVKFERTGEESFSAGC